MVRIDHANNREEENSAEIRATTGCWHGRAKTGINSWHRHAKMAMAVGMALPKLASVMLF